VSRRKSKGPDCKTCGDTGCPDCFACLTPGCQCARSPVAAEQPKLKVFASGDRLRVVQSDGGAWWIDGSAPNGFERRFRVTASELVDLRVLLQEVETYQAAAPAAGPTPSLGEE
jgi:hypothetical protein